MRVTKWDTVKTTIDGIRYINITKRDTFYITKLKVEKEYEKCNDRTERIQARLDYKAERDSLKTLLKLERENTKQQKQAGQQAIKEKRIENRGWFWTWVFIIIAFIAGFLFHRNVLTL